LTSSLGLAVRKGRRSLLLIALLLSLGAVTYKVVQTVSTTQREVRKNPVTALSYLPESSLHVKEFRRSKVENGRKVWEVTGEEADYFKEQNEAVIKKPRFLYYNRNGQAAETNGEIARLYLGENELKKMQIEGNIQVKYEQYLLKSAEAIYLPAQQRVVLPKRTTVTGDGMELEGSRMEVDLETQIIRMFDDVKTKIEPAKMNRRNGKGVAGAQASEE
jgi:LPS export ABC transporter protein LptC